MIGTVVVTLDGSELAEKALPYGARIAERANAVLHLLTVVPGDAPAERETQAQEYLREKARAFSGRVQISIRLGNPAEQIIDASDELANPIIVMTTHGRSGIGRWLYGSVADKVVHGCEAPVLLIRSAVAEERPRPVRRIAVPLDGSAYSEAAVPYAEELARIFEAELTLVRVAETAQLYAMMSGPAMAPASADALNMLTAQVVQEAQTYLAQVAERLRSDGFEVQTETLEGMPTDQLLAYEREGNVDLVVMASRGRGGLTGLVLGSVAERVLKSGTTPVMMVKPTGKVQPV